MPDSNIQTSYRYTLERGPWLNGAGTVLFVMLNPSTADETQDDPTIRRCIGFAQAWGFSRLTVANLYAVRATDPRELWLHHDPIGPWNKRSISKLASDADQVIVAWGATPHPDPNQPHRMLRTLGFFHGGVVCLGHTKDGHPRHPLYVPKAAQRVPYQRAGAEVAA
jgi:hypothetical protein